MKEREIEVNLHEVKVSGEFAALVVAPQEDDVVWVSDFERGEIEDHLEREREKKEVERESARE